jgi:hypothetical protein
MKTFVNSSILPACVAVLLASLLTSCVSGTAINQVPAARPLEVQAMQKKKPIMFRKIMIKLKRGEEIGTVYMGFSSSKLYWKQGGYLNFSDTEFNQRFREELEAANYEVVGDPDSLFEDPSAWRPNCWWRA